MSTIHAVLDWHRLVGIIAYDLGDFGDMECRLEPSDNLFGAKLSSMSPEQYVAYCREVNFSPRRLLG